MSPKNAQALLLDDPKIPVRLKLSALWASLLFLYLYVDYFHLYMPGQVADLQKGKVFDFQISQTFLLLALSSMTLPALMIYLCLVLPAKRTRQTNLLFGLLYIPYTLFNLAGEAWMHMVFGAAVEVMLLCFIVYYACTWPASQPKKPE